MSSKFQAPGDSSELITTTKVSKKLLARQRLTRAQAILQAVGNGQAVTVPPPPKKKKSILKTEKAIVTRHPADYSSGNSDSTSVEKIPTDIWKEVTDGNDQTNHQKIKRKRKDIVGPCPNVPAVQIDAPGCSFNPDRNLHQDAVADAVAKEMKKEYDRALRPSAPMKLVDYDVEDDELNKLLVDADYEEYSDEDPIEDAGLFVNKSKVEPKTQKMRARAARIREEQRILQERRKAKKLRADLSNLKQVEREVEATLTEREIRAARRRADREEIAQSQPPRLGKLRFEPMTTQVLTTDELEEAGGSLRKIKPLSMLAKERYKSLQRRGIIEPRRKVIGKVGKKVVYIHGKRGDNAIERQAEVDEIRASRLKKVKEMNMKKDVVIAGNIF